VVRLIMGGGSAFRVPRVGTEDDLRHGDARLLPV
jgi:hypothetical protein